MVWDEHSIILGNISNNEMQIQYILEKPQTFFISFIDLINKNIFYSKERNDDLINEGSEERYYSDNELDD